MCVYFCLNFAFWILRKIFRLSHNLHTLAPLCMMNLLYLSPRWQIYTITSYLVRTEILNINISNEKRLINNMQCMLQTCKCSTVGLWNHLLFIDSVLALLSLSWPDFVWHSCTLCQKLLALKCEEPLKIIIVFPNSVQGVQSQTKTEDTERNLFQEGGGEEKDETGREGREGDGREKVLGKGARWPTSSLYIPMQQLKC